MYVLQVRRSQEMRIPLRTRNDAESVVISQGCSHYTTQTAACKKLETPRRPSRHVFEILNTSWLLPSGSKQPPRAGSHSGQCPWRPACRCLQGRGQRILGHLHPALRPANLADTVTQRT